MGGGHLIWAEAWVVAASCRIAALCRVVASAGVATQEAVGGRAFLAGAEVPMEATPASPHGLLRGQQRDQAGHPRFCAQRAGPSGIS